MSRALAWIRRRKRQVINVGLGFAYGLSIAASLYPELGLYRLPVVVLGALGTAGLYLWQDARSAAVSARYFHTLADVLLGACLEEVRQANPAITSLRGNVMLPGGPRFGPKPLRMVVWRGQYSGAELEQTWLPDIGCAGTALASKDQVYYDATEAHESRKGMTETQREVTAGVISALGTPIFRPSDEDRAHPLGVLMLDSGEPIALTQFNAPVVLEIAAKYATLVGMLAP